MGIEAISSGDSLERKEVPISREGHHLDVRHRRTQQTRFSGAGKIKESGVLDAVREECVKK